MSVLLNILTVLKPNFPPSGHYWQSARIRLVRYSAEASAGLIVARAVM